MKIALLSIALLAAGFLLGLYVATPSSSHGDRVLRDESGEEFAERASAIQPGSTTPQVQTASLRQEISSTASEETDPGVTDAVGPEDVDKLAVDANFFRDLKGVEREKYLRDHRQEYMQTHRDGIVRTLKELEETDDRLIVNQKAYYLAMRNICLLLDAQNRAELTELGVPVSIRNEGDDYCFKSGNWVYRFTGAEFPEWVYLHDIRKVRPKGMDAADSYPPMPSHILKLLRFRADQALAAFPGSGE